MERCIARVRAIHQRLAGLRLSLRRIYLTECPKDSRTLVSRRRQAAAPEWHGRWCTPRRGLGGLAPMALPAPSNGPSPLLAISIIVGLPLALWTYKCLMLVLFQRKIIYMGYVPPGARQEELRDVPPKHLKDISCKEVRVKSESAYLSRIIVHGRRPAHTKRDPPDIVMIYLQGNAGNPLHRLPLFQRLLNPLMAFPGAVEIADSLTILAVAPRSFWKSPNKTPTQDGILADYLHTLQYAMDNFPTSKIVLYGHSLGGSVAVCLLSRLSDQSETPGLLYDERHRNIHGLVLENAFASIPGMVRALYPERWLPYHHLAPLAFDKWDALAAMRGTDGADDRESSILARLEQNMLMLVSEKDEVVPRKMGDELWDASSRTKALNSVPSPRPFGRKIIVKDALHEDAWQQRQWSLEMTNYMQAIRAQTESTRRPIY
ncbi:hypothetical protein PLICRDRAFT_43389 [Plicaturopsis crispa FD-325 SS-3]|nr:hypothetical protein PLICRDRAFT_43389 [Plicaturopsis crispa FD-325 SS-3]